MKRIFFSLEEIKKKFGLPQGSQFCGYIVHLPDSDEFLAVVRESEGSTARVFSKLPEHARLFGNHLEAITEARKYGKGAIPCLLFDDDNNFMVAPCE